MFVFGGSPGFQGEIPQGQQGFEAAPRVEPLFSFGLSPEKPAPAAQPAAQPMFKFGLEEPQPAAPIFRFGDYATTPAPASQLFTERPESHPSRTQRCGKPGASRRPLYGCRRHVRQPPAPAGQPLAPEGCAHAGPFQATEPEAPWAPAQAGTTPAAEAPAQAGDPQYPPAAQKRGRPGGPQHPGAPAQASTTPAAEARCQARDPLYPGTPAETAPTHAKESAETVPARVQARPAVATGSSQQAGLDGAAVEEQTTAGGEDPASEPAASDGEEEIAPECKEAFAAADALNDKGRYAEAAAECLKVLSGPPAVVGLLEEILRGWEKERDFQEVHARKQDSDVRDLSAQLSSAKEVAASLRERKERLDVVLTAERRRREAAEAEGHALRAAMADLHGLRTENRRLDQRTRELEAELRGAENRASRPGRQVVLKSIADLEREPLRLSGPQERAALRKKLLMKWHPDKQPTPEHSALATVVMQELQNHKDWNNDA